MKVILYMAISLNGIIARENNEEDFLSHDNWNTFVKLAHKTACMIWGRKTHEVVKSWGKKYLDDIRDVKKVIVSSDKDFELEEGYLRAFSPQDALDKLQKEGFREVILSGGSGLNSSFAKEGFIDEIILNVEPVIIGKGIPLFSSQEFDLNLQLISSTNISENIVQLHYKVKK